ncbi:MAG: hypothetical protein ABIG84_08490 [archaeon]
MKKGLAIEMIGKLLIGIVLASVGIGLVMHFLGINLDIPGRTKDAVNIILKGSYVDPHTKLEVINETYTSERMANYIKTCWDNTRDIKQDMLCFIFEGEFTDVDVTEVKTILNKIDPKIPPKTNITAQFATTDMVVIYYDYTDGIIDIRS